jgi:hypothetical protein
MITLLGLRTHPLHPVVQDKTNKQDDQEIDERKSGSWPQIKLPDRFLCQKL